jgi:predicted ATPase
MNRISQLGLTHFKSFQNQQIELRALTVLAGLNNTGKSSVLQALLLLRQSYRAGLLSEVGLALNGELANIGTGRDALCEEALSDSIAFELVDEHDSSARWEFGYAPAADVLSLVSGPDSSAYEASLFGDGFHYVGPEGHSPLQLSGEIGTTRLRHPSSDSLNLEMQVEAWLDSMSLSSNRTSRAWPIVAAVLASSPGSLLLLEHPETRLHSQTQVKLGELFSLAASAGIQVVLETHSDHLLNGIRLAVHGGRLAPDDVQINFLSLNSRGLTEVVSPHIDRNGRIDLYPEGFFDVWSKSLNGLLEPAVR